MPSQKEVRWSQLKVGVLVSVALLTLIALIFLMTGSVGGLFVSKIKVHSFFENAAGLKVGGPVNLEGVTIGTVTKIAVSDDPKRRLTPVEVTMKITERYRHNLRVDSKASLTQEGVLGDTVVDINSQFANGHELRAGDELSTMETPSLTDVVKASQGTIEQFNVILAKLNSLVDSMQSNNSSIGKLLTTPDLYNQGYAAVDQLNKLATNLNAGKGSVGKFLTDDEMYNRLNDTVKHLQHVSEELDSGQGSAGKLLHDDDALYNQMTQTLAHANSILADADAGKGGLGLLTKDPAFAKKLDDTVTRLDNILNGIDQGKGTLGQLAQNDSVYRNLDKMLVDSQSLINTIRSDPRKYLTIHMKVF